MNCIDSSFWIEYFVNGSKAALIEGVVSRPAEIIVPSICLIEVGRYMARSFGEEAAGIAQQAMARSELVPLEAALAGEAVRLGLKHKLALADSIIYASARAMGATLWTLDGDFEGLPNVKYFSKRPK